MSDDASDTEPRWWTAAAAGPAFDAVDHDETLSYVFVTAGPERGGFDTRLLPTDPTMLWGDSHIVFGYGRAVAKYVEKVGVISHPDGRLPQTRQWLPTDTRLDSDPRSRWQPYQAFVDDDGLWRRYGLSWPEAYAWRDAHALSGMTGRTIVVTRFLAGIDLY